MINRIGDRFWKFKFFTRLYFKPILILSTVIVRSRHPEVLLVKGILKICSKFTSENACRSVISIKLQSNFIEITFRHGCSPVNLLHVLRTSFAKNTSGWLLLYFGKIPIENGCSSQDLDYQPVWPIYYSAFLIENEKPDYSLIFYDLLPELFKKVTPYYGEIEFTCFFIRNIRLKLAKTQAKVK